MSCTLQFVHMLGGGCMTAIRIQHRPGRGPMQVHAPQAGLASVACVHCTHIELYI